MKVTKLVQNEDTTHGGCVSHGHKSNESKTTSIGVWVKKWSPKYKHHAWPDVESSTCVLVPALASTDQSHYFGHNFPISTQILAYFRGFNSQCSPCIRGEDDLRRESLACAIKY